MKKERKDVAGWIARFYTSGLELSPSLSSLSISKTPGTMKQLVS
jgi:hypothetical protein